MKGKECKSGKAGYVLMGIGGIMLLGLLNLGFLIPFAIAVFLFYKGWKMVKRGRTPQDLDWQAGTGYPASSHDTKTDPLDLWEMQLKKEH